MVRAFLLSLAAAEHQLFQPQPLLSRGAVSPGDAVSHFGVALSAAQPAPLAYVQPPAGPGITTYAMPQPIASGSAASSTVESLLPWVLAGAALALLMLGGRH